MKPRQFLVAWAEGGTRKVEVFTTANGAQRFAMFQLQRGFWPHVVFPS